MASFAPGAPVPADTPRWLRQARELLAELHGPEAVAGVVRVTIENDAGQRVTLAAPPDSAEAQLPPLQRVILRALRDAGRPLNTKQLAGKAGYTNNSYFRKVLLEMQSPERQWIIKTARGFVPA